MKKTSKDRATTVSEGLAHGRQLGTCLRKGTNDKRVRMLEELQEGAAFLDADALTRSLSACADVSLGDTAADSEAIRGSAAGFRDAIVAFPPETKGDWKEIKEALKAQPQKAAAADGDAEAITLRNPERYMPTPTSDDHDYGDDEAVRYRYLDEKDGS